MVRESSSTDPLKKNLSWHSLSNPKYIRSWRHRFLDTGLPLPHIYSKSGDSSGPEKYVILHDYLFYVVFKFMKNKRILQDQEQICSILDTSEEKNIIN